MLKERRLAKERDFSLVYKHGKDWSDSLLVLKVLPNTLERSRIGFSAGRRLGKAVVRNKIKRRLREAARLTPVHTGWDMIFIARKRATEADYHQLSQSVKGLLKRARLLGKVPVITLQENNDA